MWIVLAFIFGCLFCLMAGYICGFLYGFKAGGETERKLAARKS